MGVLLGTAGVLSKDEIEKGTFSDEEGLKSAQHEMAETDEQGVQVVSSH